MSDLRADLPDAARSRLRATVAIIQRELARTSAPSDAGAAPLVTDELRSAFARLVTQLDLGVEPELVPCPVCGRHGMRKATRCGYCWIPLTPPASTAIVVT